MLSLCREARKFCRDADVYVSEFKAANQRIDAICRQLAELVLVNVEKKRIYQLSEFQDMQSVHQGQVGATRGQPLHALMHPMCRSKRRGSPTPTRKHAVKRGYRLSNRACPDPNACTGCS